MLPIKVVLIRADFDPRAYGVAVTDGDALSLRHRSYTASTRPQLGKLSELSPRLLAGAKVIVRLRRFHHPPRHLRKKTL